MNKSIFIAIEGGDGSGKSTQIKLLLNYLKNKDTLTYLTREPGGCPVSEDIRNIILKGDANKLDDLSELLLFSAARHEHVRQTIKPMLDKGYTVISDRFYLSTYVYQSFAGGLDFKTVENITKLAIRGTEPDLTILLDIDPKVGLIRSIDNTTTHDEKRIESKPLEYHQKIRQGFLNAAKNDNTTVVVNANQGVEKVHQDIITLIEERDIF